MVSRFFLGLGLLSATALVHPALASDARTLQIVVSTDRQSLAVYDGDKVVATSKVSTGKQGHSTPLGIFSILEKERFHESNIYSNSPMPFMQRLTWSGIALHESGYVPNHAASHGCVRMPKAFAQMLYGLTDRGVHVVISDRAVVPQPIENSALFQPQPAPIGSLFADLALRPTTSAFGGSQPEPVQVATNDITSLPMPPAAPEIAAADEAPLRILITRRGLQDNVRDLQEILGGMGFAAGNPDGLLGPTTVQAIRDFKKAHNIDANKGGLVSPELMKAVYSIAGKGEPPNGEVLVRQDFKSLFQAPVIIADPQEALGTHFFTAHDVDKNLGKAEWYGITLEDDLPKDALKRLGITSEARSRSLDAAGDALNRITMPDDAKHRIEDLLSSGSSLTITDTSMATETGPGTDFITITRKGGLGGKG